MGGIVAKLARGTARLAFWRKPDETSSDAAALATASTLIASPTADAPKSSWFTRLKQKLRRVEESAAPTSVAASVQAVVDTPAPTSVEASPRPPLVPQELEEMLELSDPVALSVPVDMLFGDDTLEAEIQVLGSSEVALASPVIVDSLAAKMGSPELEPEPEETADIAQAEIVPAETAQAQAPQANVPQPAVTPKAATVTAPPSIESTLEEGDEPDKPKLASHLLDTLTKKWVWIPSVSMAMLAVIGTLSFMLMQSKQTTYELQAELTTAKKQLKQVPIKPQVVPPLLVAHQDVAPHGVNPVAEPANAVSHEEASSQATAGSSPSPTGDIDCDISDKASVGKNLRNCIEAFNQTTAR